MKIAVIGGGAAGLIAAGEAAKNGANVTLFEKNEKLAKKLIITGKGRCNLTNFCEIPEFMRNVATNSKFLYSALSNFTPKDCMDFFENLGVKLKIERGNRVFPESDKSYDIADTLRKFIKLNGVKIEFKKVEQIITKNNKICGLIADKLSYNFNKIIICTGGMSYKSTGSTGDGYNFARDLGHKIIDLRPSLVPIETVENYGLMGLSLRNIKLSLYKNDVNFKENNAIFSEIGELLFTHFGISGPLVLSASSHIDLNLSKNYIFKIDLKPGLDENALDKRIISDFLKYKNKDFANSLNDLLPKKLIPVVVKLANIEPEKKVNAINKNERLGLINLFKNFELNMKNFRSIDEAIITKGGIDVKEINPSTMQSKLIDGLFFAGEVIDVDAYTGGFNLQIAFSTGKLAGKSAARQE